MTAAIARRLSALGIELAADTGRHYLFTRENFIVLVERTAAGMGGIGSAGMLTEHGLAYLVWRGERAFFVAKGWEQPATAGEVAALRRFSADVEDALSAV